MTTSPTITLRLLGDANIAPLGRYLENDRGQPAIRLLDTPYGQLFQHLAGADGDPAEEPEADVAIIWARPEAVSPAFTERLAGGEATDQALEREASAFADLLLAARERFQTVLVPSFTVAPWQRGLGPLDLRPNLGVAAAVQTMNRTLAQRLDRPGIYLLDADRWLRMVGPGACPPQAYFGGKVPFAPGVFEQAARDVRAALDAIGGRSKKLLIVDLDDTLWGGIVGDVGHRGLRLGGHDAIGEAFVAFQRALLALHRRGIQLGIVSKNEEAVALEAIDRHPEMVLAREHFAGWRIGWGDKAQAVAELCDELSLGTESAVFIDDNPVERARVRDGLPAVLVPEWPSDPCRYVEALGGLRAFDQPALSAEDRARGQMYAAERARRTSQETTSSLDDWLAGLEQVVVRKALDPADLTRAAQLLNKTNQMNLATRRMTERELAEWAARPGRRVWTFRVRDRFGDSGLTGILSVEADDDRLTIVDFILSCRVMARRIEEAMLSAAVAHARDRGLDQVVATYRPTVRNAPCLAWLRRSALTEGPEGRFVWDTAEPFPAPSAIRMEDEG